MCEYCVLCTAYFPQGRFNPLVIEAGVRAWIDQQGDLRVWKSFNPLAIRAGLALLCTLYCVLPQETVSILS